jgi:hypothetical protein
MAECRRAERGRTERGRFAKGCAGGPGRPRRAVEGEYLATLSGAVPADRWRAIVERAVADAIAGDARARDWLSRYLLPRPGVGLDDGEGEGQAAAVVIYLPANGREATDAS